LGLEEAGRTRRREVRALPLAPGAKDNGRVEEVVTMLIADGWRAGSQAGFRQGNARQTRTHQIGRRRTQRKRGAERARHLGTDPR